MAIRDAMAASPDMASAPRFRIDSWHAAPGSFCGDRLVCWHGGCDDLAAGFANESVIEEADFKRPHNNDDFFETTSFVPDFEWVAGSAPSEEAPECPVVS